MVTTLTGPQLFDREFLGIRARLVELGATLDRIDRAGGVPADDLRRQQILRSLQVLAEADPGRAERIQQLFSLPYDDGWRRQFGLEV